MLSSKIKKDTLVNLISFAFFGLSGLLINFIIAHYYSAETLGLFNIYYAIFIFISQFAGAGIHLSVLKNTSHDKNEEHYILINGIFAVSFNAFFYLTTAFFLRNYFNIFFTNQSYVDLIIIILPAIFFYVINKVFLAYINAKKQMVHYAIFYSLRFFLMIVALFVLISLKVEPKYCISIFLVAEFLLFIFLVLYTRKSFKKGKLSKSWIIVHFQHGYKSAIGSVLIDVNTRVDVLMLGFFTNEKMVGIYSFASMLIDGFNQLPIVFRTIVNPYITEKYFSHDTVGLRKQICWGRNLTYKLLLPLGVLAIILYPVTLKVLGFYVDYSSSILPFTILMVGALISIGYAPFLMIFNQTGFPGTQSVLYFLIFITNVIFNAILIPFFGINGAAIATAISFALSMYFIKYLSNKKLQISL